MKTLKLALIVLLAALVCGNLFATGKRGGAGNQPLGELSSAELSDLILMREEEKFARDTYISLDEIWNDRIFANISASEQRHMDAMKQAMIAYGVDDLDPVTDDTVGVFSNPAIDTLYADALNRGDDSLFDALTRKLHQGGPIFDYFLFQTKSYKVFYGFSPSTIVLSGFTPHLASHFGRSLSNHS